MQQNRQATAEKRIWKVYRRLARSVTDQEGYGGNLDHDGYFHDWKLRMFTSDFGEVSISAQNNDLLVVFFLDEQATLQAHQPVDNDTLEILAGCFERAKWVDRLSHLRGGDIGR